MSAPLKGNRYFILSVVFGAGAFVLGWKFGDPMSFATVASVALGGGHLTNAVERRYPTIPESA